MFIQALNAVFSTISTLFTYALGVNLGGVTLGVIIGGMLLVTILFKVLMNVLNIEMNGNYKTMANQLKKPGKFEIKK